MQHIILVHAKSGHIAHVQWYGESEKKLGEIFDACDALGAATELAEQVRAWWAGA